MLLVVILFLFLAFNRVMGLDRIWGGENIRSRGTIIKGPKNWTEHLRRIRLRFSMILLEALENGLLFILQRCAAVWSLTGGRLLKYRRAQPRDSWTITFYCICGLILICLVGPILLIFPVSFTSSVYLRFPPTGFSLQWYEEGTSGSTLLEQICMAKLSCSRIDHASFGDFRHLWRTCFGESPI